MTGLTKVSGPRLHPGAVPNKEIRHREVGVPAMNLASAPPMVPQPPRSRLAAQLSEALDRGMELGRLAGWAACARHYGHPVDAPDPRPSLISVPAGGAA